MREVTTEQWATLPDPPLWVRAAAAVIPALPAGRYRLINRLCRRPPPPFWARLRPESGAYRFRCDLRDAIVREVCFTGRYEPQETALVKGILRPGMTFVDVGANWGYFTLLAAHLVGRMGKVVSLEPEPRLFATLRDNVETNALHRVTAIQVAAASGAGVLSLVRYDEATDKWGLSKLVDGAVPGTTIEVRTAALDMLLDEQGVDGVDLVKIDIEGAEELALRGMAGGLLRRRYERILLELHPTILAERGRDVGDVIGLLESCGYRGWWIDHSVATTRRAAYASTTPIGDLLRPITPGAPVTWPIDAWPHTLWQAPHTGKLACS